MQESKLLDRQTELLRHLTGAELLFGGDGSPGALQESGRHGIGSPGLRLEAEMSFRKRMGKIEKILLLTCQHLGRQRPQLFRRFAVACPPRSYRHYDEALCFYEFLLDHWQTVSPDPPFIVDIARLEMALARTRLFRAGQNMRPAVSTGPLRKTPLLRLADGVEVLPMDYDLRPLFEDSVAARVSVQRKHHLLVAPGLKVVEIPNTAAGVFKQLEAWTALDCVLKALAPDGAAEASLRPFLEAGFLEMAA